MDPLPLAGAAEVEDIEMPDAQDLDFLALQVDQMTIAHKITDSEHIRGTPLNTLIQASNARIIWHDRDKLIMKAHLARHSLHLGNFEIIAIDDLIRRLGMGEYAAADDTYKSVLVKKLKGALGYLLKKLADQGHVVLTERAPHGATWMSWTRGWMDEGWNGDESRPKEEEEDDEDEEVDLEALAQRRFPGGSALLGQVPVQQFQQQAPLNVFQQQPAQPVFQQPAQEFQPMGFQQPVVQQPVVQQPVVQQPVVQQPVVQQPVLQQPPVQQPPMQAPAVQHPPVRQGVFPPQPPPPEQGFQRPVAQPVTQTVAQPVAQPVAQTVPQPTVQQPPIQPAIQPPIQPAVQPQPPQQQTQGLAQSRWSGHQRNTPTNPPAAGPAFPNTVPADWLQNQQGAIVEPQPFTAPPVQRQHQLFPALNGHNFKATWQAPTQAVDAPGFDRDHDHGRIRVQRVLFPTAPQVPPPKEALGEPSGWERPVPRMPEAVTVPGHEHTTLPRQTISEPRQRTGSQLEDYQPRQHHQSAPQRPMPSLPEQQVMAPQPVQRPRSPPAPAQHPEVVEPQPLSLSLPLQRRTHIWDDHRASPREEMLRFRRTSVVGALDLATGHGPESQPQLQPRRLVHELDLAAAPRVSYPYDHDRDPTPRPQRRLSLGDTTGRPEIRNAPFDSTVHPPQGLPTPITGPRFTTYRGAPPSAPASPSTSTAPSLPSRIFPGDSASNYGTQTPTPIHNRIIALNASPRSPHFSPPAVPLSPHPRTAFSSPTMPRPGQHLHASLLARTVIVNGQALSQVDVYQRVVNLVVLIRAFERVGVWGERVDRARAMLGVLLGYLPATSHVGMTARIFLGSERDLRRVQARMSE